MCRLTLKYDNDKGSILIKTLFSFVCGLLDCVTSPHSSSTFLDASHSNGKRVLDKNSTKHASVARCSSGITEQELYPFNDLQQSIPLGWEMRDAEHMGAYRLYLQWKAVNKHGRAVELFPDKHVRVREYF